MIFLPKPKFFVFYNSEDQQPEQREFRLSDSYMSEGDKADLELVVIQLNINAISECIEEGILTEFLKTNRSGVISMSIYE